MKPEAPSGGYDRDRGLRDHQRERRADGDASLGNKPQGMIVGVSGLAQWHPFPRLHLPPTHRVVSRESGR